MLVLDTNVISELMKDAPDPQVKKWFERLSDSDFYTTVVSVSEIGADINLLDEGKRRDSIQQKSRLIFKTLFADKILPFNENSAAIYAKIVPIRKKSGKPISVLNAIIASICIEHEASLVTRNTTDFEGIGLELIDPWSTQTTQKNAEN